MWEVPLKLVFEAQSGAVASFRSRQRWICVPLRSFVPLGESLLRTAFSAVLFLSCLLEIVLHFMSATGQHIPERCLSFCLGHPSSSNTIA